MKQHDFQIAKVPSPTKVARGRRRNLSLRTVCHQSSRGRPRPQQQVRRTVPEHSCGGGLHCRARDTRAHTPPDAEASGPLQRLPPRTRREHCTARRVLQAVVVRPQGGHPLSRSGRAPFTQEDGPSNKGSHFLRKFGSSFLCSLYL